MQPVGTSHWGRHSRRDHNRLVMAFADVARNSVRIHFRSAVIHLRCSWRGHIPRVQFLGESTMNISTNELMWELVEKHPMK